MSQQTTVQQFINEINRRVAILRIEPCGIVRDTMIDNLLIDSDGYLEMEKEQITTAYKADRYPCSDEDAEHYYNETYKTQA